MRGAFPTGWRPESLARSVPPSFAGREDPPRTPPRRRFAPRRRAMDFLHSLLSGAVEDGRRRGRPSPRRRSAGRRARGPRRRNPNRSPPRGMASGCGSGGSLSSRPVRGAGRSCGRCNSARRPRSRPGRRSSLWIKRPAWGSVLEEMGNPVVRADAGRFPHRVAARIAGAIRSALSRGEGGPSPHPSPAALRAASAREGLSPQPGRVGCARSRYPARTRPAGRTGSRTPSPSAPRRPGGTLSSTRLSRRSPSSPAR